MKVLNLVFAAVLMLPASISTVVADELPDHFEGLPAETLAQAMTNFSEYNAKLADIIKQDKLVEKDLHEVHRLTYTLENALGKMASEVSELAETLEAVHLASESGDADTVTAQGQTYLDTARQLVK
ncbi:hypothetical protein Tel_03665 [Candidatus Tenderia electrophaga]|jgi:hypothetical protein|uniref:Uncharacterized protein n=1 Tax=Candidatus Tenderia electrophaga TaxID=1748243 RepID=A0A0S2TAX8_9GAMM|nr:hypothetical protein Tel_03665 [Candidatus Tenderia electrophaga]